MYFTKGLETFVKYYLNSRFNFQISYTFLDSKIDSGQINYSSEYDLKYFIKGGMEYKLPGSWTITLRYIFRQGILYQPVLYSAFDNNLEVYQPIFDSLDKKIRYSSYNLIDFSLSKLFPISEELTIVTFGSINNTFNFKNLRSYIYNFDYSNRTPNYYNQRTIYFGAVFYFL